MKKHTQVIFFLIIISLGLLSGCSSSQKPAGSGQPLDINLTVSFSVNSIPIFYMAENNLLGEGYNLNVETHKTREEAAAKILKEDADAALLSVQEAANIYNRGLPVQLINAGCGAGYFLMTNNPSVGSYDDLKGKTIWTSLRGGPVAFTLNQLLLNNTDLDPEKDLEYQYMSFSELTNMIIHDLKDIEVYSLRDPYASQIMLAKEDAVIMMNLDEEWEKTFNRRIPLSGIVMSKALLDTDKELAARFNIKYNEAIQWTVSNPEEAARLGEKYLKGLSLSIIEESIKNMNIELIPSSKLEEELNFYYNLWLEYNPEMINSKNPDSDFYY